MKLYNKKGELLTEPKIDALQKRKGRATIYVLDPEVRDFLEQLLLEFKQVKLHLASLSKENITERDVR